MEYCPGGDLETWKQRSGPLPLATALLLHISFYDYFALLHQGASLTIQRRPCVIPDTFD
jgi:hypothetical protein